MGLSLGRTQTSNTSVGLSQATLKLVPGAPAELEKATSGTLRKVNFEARSVKIMRSFECVLLV